MGKPSYKLYLDSENEKKLKNKNYRKSELEDMTTVQLRDICMQEKIIQGVLHPLNREELIQIILRYRGLPEARLIRKKAEGGLERITKVLQAKLGTEKKGGHIRTPAKLILYPELDLTILDGYQIDLPEAYQRNILESNVILVGEDRTICTILNLETSQIKDPIYYLTRSNQIPFQAAEQKKYYLLFFEKKESDYLYQVYYDEERTAWATLNYYKVPIADLEIRMVEDTQECLTIDFGTSNTTAGMFRGCDASVWQYDEEEKTKQMRGTIEIVPFIEDTGREKRKRNMVPSMVSVEDVSERETVLYAFGYEAKKSLRSHYADESFSIFYEIKRWAGSYKEDQELIDKEGNTTFVKKEEIIRQYLLFIIQTAEGYFKCRFHRLQITCPVKVKAQFQRMLMDVLPDYEIERAQQIDEGTAVIYNTIHSLIGKKQYDHDEQFSALILDCGGGTTDLTSCLFTIKDKRISYQIEIDTVYENGDTNFGGNNLTYRIMQYLKVLLAEFYRKQPISSSSFSPISKSLELFPTSEQEVYEYIDRKSQSAFYYLLEQAYEKAEQLIPTRFKEYENCTNREYYLIKNNFYFLFELAEQIKRLLYQRHGIFRIGLDGEQKEITIPHWDLVIWKEGHLTGTDRVPDISIDSKELEKALIGDIYDILNRFFKEFYERGTLEEYSIIKLTGQSCQIGLFRDALKEFIPGKSIRFQRSGKEEGMEECKLACVKGAILYAQAGKSGMADAIIHYHLPRIPYAISAYSYDQTEKILIATLDRDQSHGFLSRHKGIRVLELFLKDEKGQVKYQYSYENKPEEYQPLTYEEIREQYKEYTECILQDDTDTILDTEVKFFVFAAKDQWGFYLVPIMREQTQLYLGKDAYYPFENNLWETNFFDGLR